MYWRHSRRFSLFYMPLELLSAWANALIKIWVSSHPAKQSWLNRGGAPWTQPAERPPAGFRSLFADYLFYFSMAAFILAIGCFSGLLPFVRETPLYLGVDLRASPQIILEVKELIRRAGRNSILIPMVREAPLHSHDPSQVLHGTGTVTSAFANVFGYEPVVLPRRLPRPSFMDATPRAFRRTSVDPAVPRIGFNPVFTSRRVPEMDDPEVRDGD